VVIFVPEFYCHSKKQLEEKKMDSFNKRSFGIAIFALVGIVFVANITAPAQKSETIRATAMGTNQQLGRMISVDIYISRFSAGEDQKALLEAFAEGGSEGLANALDKMSAKGRMAITGTLGFDVNYIREFKMPDGTRKIRFVTDRPIRFGEHWAGSRSTDYTISIGEINFAKVNGKTKNTGTLIPAARIKLNKEGQIEIEALQNPWKLNNIKVYK
jgi:hypothetical protein